MTWTAVLILIVGILIKMLTSPPSAVVAWVVSKYALHPKLDSKDITVTFNGKSVGEEEKIRFTNYFNEANFLERHHIFPGSEDLFLNPDSNVVPFVIKAKSKNKEINFFVYTYDEHIDVVKQWKKKIASYSLSSENLQEFTVSSSKI